MNDLKDFGKRRRFSLLLAILATTAATPRADAAPKAGKGPSNVVYVESNDPAGNTILAYKRHNDGSLTMLPGSPFATGGLGITPTFNLGPFDSDSNIITNPEQTLLFAVNGGSDSISVFDIANSGALTPVPGSPFPSGGSNPVGLGLKGDVLCVVNKSNNPGHTARYLPNYTTLRVNARGRLITIPRAAISEDMGSDPTQALPSPMGSLVFGCDFLGGALRSFGIAPNGRLAPRAIVAPPFFEFADSGAPALPLGLAVHPTRPLLYVGFVTINRIGVYRYTAAGALHYIRSVPDSGSGVCWLLLNKDATRMYASNTGDPSISVYDLTWNPSQPIEIQKINLRVAPGSNPGCYQFALDPKGEFLQVVAQQFATTSTVQANALHVLSVDSDGMLTEVDSSPTHLPVRNLTRPQGVLAF